jgi:hypothetical protein
MITAFTDAFELLNDVLFISECSSQMIGLQFPEILSSKRNQETNYADRIFHGSPLLLPNSPLTRPSYLFQFTCRPVNALT